MNIQELRERADRKYEKIKAKKREMYRLARDSGFTTGEAAILSGSNAEAIKKLAQER